MTQNNRIKTLNDLRRRKYYLQKQIRIRSKILDYRIRKFEQKLTVPNITRELFRDSRLEWIAPIATAYFARRFTSGKDLLGSLGGFFAGFGSIFSVFKRSKAKKTTDSKNTSSSNYTEDQMFI